jgi:hypothetical protein
VTPFTLSLLNQFVDALTGHASAHHLPFIFGHVCFGIPVFHALRKPFGTAFPYLASHSPPIRGFRHGSQEELKAPSIRDAS